MAGTAGTEGTAGAWLLGVRRGLVGVTLASLGLGLGAGAAVGQRSGGAGDADPAAAVAAVRSGTVRLSFPADPGVCGDGHGGVRLHLRDGDEFGDTYVGGRRHVGSGWHGPETRCLEGPVRVELTMDGGRVVDAVTEVGGGWTGAADVVVGSVDPRSAARMLARRSVEPRARRAASAMLLAAVAARDAPVLTDLREVALDGDAPRETRRQAVFWMSQAGETGAVEAIEAVRSRGGEELGESTVFALSQLPEGAGSAALRKIATGDSSPKQRASALFWLGQSDDPGATAFIAARLREDPSPDVRKRALFALSQRRDAAALDALIREVRTGTDRDLRRQAIFWLGQSDDPRAEQVLRQILGG